MSLFSIIEISLQWQPAPQQYNIITQLINIYF
nr:MAG TPA: hypothetical protein [Caudoviricetes sp.]